MQAAWSARVRAVPVYVLLSIPFCDAQRDFGNQLKYEQK